MSGGGRINRGHSVFQRLLNRARESGDDFNLLLVRYGVERFMYRLGISPFRGSFILKGASLFLVWRGQNYRVTRDVDLLGYGDPDPELLLGVFRAICEIGCTEDDGIDYDVDTLKVEEIREGQEYDGVRVTLSCLLHQARIPIQIDIGFGDAVSPAPELIEYPTLFGGPAPVLRAYPRYTLVAEKLEAMVKLGLANSRMKDFYDIWLVSKIFSFDGELLRSAMTRTFARRRTAFPASRPFALTPAFYEDHQKQIQWAAFIRKSKPEMQPGDLAAVVSAISDFVFPVIESIQKDRPFSDEWLPDQGWSN
jgi:hypothetical protein